MAKRKKVFRKGLTIFLAILLLIVGTVGGFLGMHYLNLPNDSDPLPPVDGGNSGGNAPIVTGDMEIHFPELGNKYTGDCTYIQIGEVDILIDAGSRDTSIPSIAAYLEAQMTDDVLDYVIVTHAHQDHYAGFATRSNVDSLFDLFEVGTIIDFPQVVKGKENTQMYGYYLRERNEEVAAGAKHYTADAFVDQPIDLGNGAVMEILDSYFYYHVSAEENNHSVCTLFRYGEESFLFTGDLEAEGEEYLVQMNDLPEVTLYKAGHHGSKTSSSNALLSVIKPEIVTVCCCAGSSEYTDKNENQFPTQAFVDRVAPYTDRVYVTTLCVDYKAGKITSMNGNIVLLCTADGVNVSCSNNNDKLKDTAWFKQNRTCPDAWK